MGKVKKLITKEHPTRKLPRRIKRPCDYKLQGAIYDLEAQVGTVEGYNRLCDAAARMKAKIDRGEGEAGLEFYTENPYPAIYSK